MKKVLLLFLLLGSTLYSQNYYGTFKKYKIDNINNLEHKGDSLIRRCLENDKLHDGAKIAHDLSIYFYRKNLSKSIKYCGLELDYLEELNINDKEYENALYNMSFFYRENNEYDQSIEYARKVIKTNHY